MSRVARVNANALQTEPKGKDVLPKPWRPLDDFLLLFAYNIGRYGRTGCRLTRSLGGALQEMQLHSKLPRHRSTGRTFEPGTAGPRSARASRRDLLVLLECIPLRSQ